MPSGTIICGDSLEVLRGLSDESVDCVITSPPYWGLRDYGVDGQLGLESHFNEYISKLIAIFDEVKRVLKKEGTCWVNLGDTYASGGGASRHKGYHDPKYPNGRSGSFDEPATNPQKGAQEKSLCQIPSRFAIAMTDNGWILRNIIIWNKLNPMPSSVLDRLTNKYEHVFFFVKNKKYYFDGDSIRVPFETKWEKRDNGPRRNREKGYDSKFNKLNTKQYNTAEGTKTRKQEEMANKLGIRRNPEQVYDRNPLGKNRGDVWSTTSQPYPEAHFAMFPEALIEPMILAGCPKDGLVLDPFFGAGTTGVVAKKLGRHYLGIELNEEYIKIAEKRIAGTQNPLL